MIKRWALAHASIMFSRSRPSKRILINTTQQLRSTYVYAGIRVVFTRQSVFVVRGHRVRVILRARVRSPLTRSWSSPAAFEMWNWIFFPHGPTPQPCAAAQKTTNYTSPVTQPPSPSLRMRTFINILLPRSRRAERSSSSTVCCCVYVGFVCVRQRRSGYHIERVFARIWSARTVRMQYLV